MILIIGYGRAGKRHARNIEALGYKWRAFDPAIAEYNSWFNIREQQHLFEAVVIATPPDLHLSSIEVVAKWGIPIFCEKPLCDLGQLAQAKALGPMPNLYFTWNYRWHPCFDNLRPVKHRDIWWNHSSQSREPWPKWGFLLDHLAHAFDLLYWQSGFKPEVKYAEHQDTYLSYPNSRSTWHVNGTVDNTPFVLKDYVDHFGTVRRVDMRGPDWQTQISKTPVMFERMWQDFHGIIRGSVVRPLPGLGDALVVQECLETCYRLAGER